MNTEHLKRSRVIDILICIGFVGALLALALIGIFKEKEVFSYFENRNLAQMPELSNEGVLDGSYFSALDKYLTDQAPGRKTMLRYNTLIDMKLLHRPVVNEVVVKDDILLEYQPYDKFSLDDIPDDVAVMTDHLSSVRDAAEDVGAEFYYVMVPCQYAYFADDYPWYLNNNAAYTEASRAALKASLTDAGVRYKDVNDTFEALGSPRELGSTIDNHYPLYAAYLAVQSVLEQVNADTGLNIPILHDEDVQFHELPNFYLGSRNRKLMGLWHNGEKLFWMGLWEDVPFQRWDVGHESSQTVYAWPAEGDDVLYQFYMGGDVPETIIDTDRDSLPSVLVYGDSFSNAMEVVLYTSFNEMHSLDYREYREKTLRQYIQEYQPDVVLCIRDYESLLNPNFNGTDADTIPED